MSVEIGGCFGFVSLTLVGGEEGSTPQLTPGCIVIHSSFPFCSLLSLTGCCFLLRLLFATYPLNVSVLCIPLSPSSLPGSMQAGAWLPELRISRGVYSWCPDLTQGIKVKVGEKGQCCQTWPGFTSQLGPLLAVDLSNYFALFFSLSFFTCEMGQ